MPGFWILLGIVVLIVVLAMSEFNEDIGNFIKGLFENYNDRRK